MFFSFYLSILLLFHFANIYAANIIQKESLLYDFKIFNFSERNMIHFKKNKVRPTFQMAFIHNPMKKHEYKE